MKKTDKTEKKTNKQKTCSMISRPFPRSYYKHSDHTERGDRGEDGIGIHLAGIAGPGFD